MGYGSWTSSSWTNYTTSKGYTASSSASEMYTARRMKDVFDPTQFKFRESCDSAEHPQLYSYCSRARCHWLYEFCS